MGEHQRVTLREEDLYAKAEAREDTLTLVVFRLASEWYGIKIADVNEVLNVEKIAFLPSSPEYIAGIFNLRGNILSVTDLRKVFGLPHEELTARSRLVVISSGALETGLLVDEVVEPLEVPLSRIDPALVTIAPDRAECLSGTTHIDKKFIGILKIEMILRAIERNAP